jgi:hypothetical protein
MNRKGKLCLIIFPVLTALCLALSLAAWAAMPQGNPVAIFEEEGFRIELLSFSEDRGTILARFKATSQWGGELELFEPRENTYLFASDNRQLSFISSDFNGRPRFKPGIPRAFYIRFVGSEDPQARYLLTTTFKGESPMDLAFQDLVPHR